MTWVRLYLTVEGETERTFAERTLKPHLAQFSVDVRPSIVLTNRKLGTRGGGLIYARIEKDIRNRMKEDPNAEARFSTMLDLYALPADFPGHEDAAKESVPARKAACLEQALSARLADPRFLPYLQLHEFEALLYCDLAELERRIEGLSLKRLKAETAGLPPEEINEREESAPSRRLVGCIPRYQRLKVRVGALAAAAIGLPVLREKCPHFNDWLTRLEKLAA
jgi:hypothetical protein